MAEPETTLTIRRAKEKRHRLIGWIAIYILLIVAFAFAVYWQARRVNTLGFANGSLQLTTSKTQYTVGDTISYTLTNGLNVPVTLVNNCPQEPLAIYSWTNNSWVRIHDTESASACVNEPKEQTIPPGGKYTQSLANWPNLFSKPGIYRVVSLATNYTALPYYDFQVVAPPQAPQKQVIIQQVITPVYIRVPSGGGDGGGGD